MPRTPAIQPQHGSRPLGKIEVLPNAIHTIAVQAISECYGVVGITAPRLHNGQPIMLASHLLQQPTPLAVLDPRTFEVIRSWSMGAEAWWVTPP